MNDRSIVFIGSIFLLILMKFFANEELKNGLFYYLLIFILSINVLSYFFVHVLNKIFEGFNFLILKITYFFNYIIENKNKILFFKTSMTMMIIMTLGWLIFVGYLIFIQKGDFDFSCLLNIKFDGLSLNEWGDFSAGFIAPLALGWLAYSIYYQKKEFENVHSSLKDQVAELEIEKYYTSYELYVNKIEFLINSINNKMNTKSLNELNKGFILANPNPYLEIAIDVKKIFLLDKNLVKLLENHKSNEKFKLALQELTEQYNMLYLEDINLIKEIILKFYFFIAISNKEIKHEIKYLDFSKLDFWIDNFKKEKILQMIDKIEGETLFDKKINPAFDKLQNYKELLD